jgi:hypothetical protein
MKTIKFVAFLFYRYYSRGQTRSVPYFSAMCAIVFLLYVHLFQILIITRQVDTFIPIEPSDSRLTKYLIMLLIMSTLYFLLTLLIKKNELLELKYSEEKIRKGNITLVCYVILSVMLLFSLMFLVPNR